MREIERAISTLVESQFPDFYKEQGPNFIDFVTQYYAWMEQTNQAVGASRSLFDTRDIDKTSDEFVKYFKEKYLKNTPLLNSAEGRQLVKHSTSVYGTKGSEQGVKLVMRGMYGEDATVYFPGNDLLRTSDGTWVKPTYLELSVSDRTKQFIAQEIIGNISGAKAFLESLVRRRIGTKYVDVAYLSNLRGSFQTGEQITTSANQVLLDAPQVVGSLSELTVSVGGADFAVGDIFDVVSSRGKQGKARVTEISNQTGTVNFIFIDALTSGGWGYSNTANVIISSKVLTVNTVSNANTSITNFQRFETVTQTLANIAYTIASGNNLIFDIGSRVENYYPNNAVAANGVIVQTNRSTNTTGFIVIAPNVGQINLDSTFTVVAVNAVSQNAVITSFADRTVTANVTGVNTGYVGVHSIVGGSFIQTPYANLVGGTSNTVALVANASMGTGATFSINKITDTEQVLLSPDFLHTKNTGNVIFYDVRLNGYNANTAWFGVDDTFNANTQVNTATKSVLLSNASHYSANSPILYYVSSGNTANIGLTTNTVYYVGAANNTHVSLKATKAGTVITLTKGATETGHHLVGPLRELSDGTIAFHGLGFTKFPGATMDSTLLDCLRFESKTIGSIASLKGINPGTDYNMNPFVAVIEEAVVGYDKHDYVMSVTPISGAFVYGERIEETLTAPAVQLTYTGFAGTDAQGNSTSSPIVGEFVYQANSTDTQAAKGYVVEYGSGTMKLRDVTGTFTITATSTYPLHTFSTNATANVTNINTGVTITSTARALVKEVANSSYMALKRINLENTFSVGGTIVGRTSGAQATVVSVAQVNTLPVLGLNANIGANVQTANNVVTKLQVYDSGYGYENLESVTLTKEGSLYEVSAVAQLGKQGIGAGFFSTTRGFLDADKRLQDNDYYQEYSYEVQTKIPFSEYVDVLKQVAHVAGTKMFGRVSSTSQINTTMTAINTVVIS